MQLVKLKDIKNGEFIRITTTANKTYIKGEYIREIKKYAVQDCEDANRYRYLKGSKMVAVGFTY